jgi:hypothetical protein
MIPNITRKMTCTWMLAAALGVSLLSLNAVDAAAQGPQGNGAEEAAKSDSGIHISNPIKWVKKDPHTETTAVNPASDQNAKLGARLQMEGVLAADANVKETCATIKSLGDCVAALHVSRDLGLDFDCLKSKLSGVQTNLDHARSCASATNGKPVDLAKAIHSLLPRADAKAEAKKAEAESREDLKELGTGI